MASATAILVSGGGAAVLYSPPSTLFLGTSSAPVATVIVGNGDTAVSPVAKVIRFTNASGTDNAAASGTIQAPLSTGNALPGTLVFKVGQQVAGSSAVLQTAGVSLTLSHTTAGGHLATFANAVTLAGVLTSTNTTSGTSTTAAAILGKSLGLTENAYVGGLLSAGTNVLVNGATVGTSGNGVLAMLNGTAPTTSPANVGQLYVLAGALMFRGASGTVTTIAVA